jgi:hypothetical protein
MSVVFDDAEMDRIVALPRKVPWTPERTAQAQSLVTAWLRAPGGTMVLKAAQAQALVEAHDSGALVGELAAGSGKALLGFLLPVALKAQRTLLLVPAKLRDQTFDVHQDLARHWRLPPLLGMEDSGPAPTGGEGGVVRVMSYESISHINYASYIDEFDPDLIIADEAHFLSRMSSGRSKRVFRFLKQARRAGRSVRFVPMSGTMRRKSFRECAHLYEAALGPKSPLPTHYPSLEQWCYALDEGIKPDARYQPGALLRLCTPQDPPDLDGVRGAVRRRLVDTHGVVATTELSCSLPLTLQVRPVTVPDAVRQAMHKLRTEYELPTGDTVDAGVTFWAHAREIASGFAYRWLPAAPPEWLAARKAWNAFVRARLAAPGKLRLDTPLQVWNAVADGHFGDVPEWRRWCEVRGTFEPKTVPYWISDWLVRDAEQWALETGGIVWVSHAAAYTQDVDDDEFGKAFQKIPYFGAGDERIRSYRGTGKNLTQWSKALIMAFPSSGATLEQLLARHHREKQTADLVEFYFYAHSLELVNAVRTCLGDANFQQTTSGSPQRILNANLLDANGRLLRLDALVSQANNDPMFG